MDGTAAMHRTLMLYVNESGFYALNEKYSAENLLVNTLDAVKHSVKLSGRLRKDGTPSNAHGYFKYIKNLCDAIL